MFETYFGKDCVPSKCILCLYIRWPWPDIDTVVLTVYHPSVLSQEYVTECKRVILRRSNLHIYHGHIIALNATSSLNIMLVTRMFEQSVKYVILLRYIFWFRFEIMRHSHVIYRTCIFVNIVLTLRLTSFYGKYDDIWPRKSISYKLNVP